jgi:hypothetical protein
LGLREYSNSRDREDELKSHHGWWEGLCLQHLGSAFTLCGNHGGAYLALLRSKSIFGKLRFPENECATTSYLAERPLQLGDVAQAAFWAERASELAAIRPVELSIVPAALRLKMTMGSPILKDFVASADSVMVERLRKAGVIFIGRTNAPEFGLGSHTYNPVYGVTRNAYD